MGTVVDVIVPTYNRPEMTDACLEAIRTTAPSARIIVVDNGSARAATYDADIIVRHATNRGFAAGCNSGAALAETGTVVFLNNDTIPLPGWLEPLIEAVNQGHLSQPRLIYPNRSIQCAGVNLRIRNSILTAENRQSDDPSGIRDAVTGACLAISTQAFRALGGFDERYWNGYEDVDLCLRARRAGWTCWYEASSTVIHLESQSGPERWVHVAQNVRLLHETWISTWQQLATS